MRIRQVRPDEEERVIAFLHSVFQPGPEETFLDPAQIRWKYFEPGPDWPGSRSYVLEFGGEIVAHGCVWPLMLAAPSGNIRAVHVIDWGASRKVPGVGLVLLKQIEELAEFRIAVGGTPAALAISHMDKRSSPEYGVMTSYVRVIRPWLQFSLESNRTWKSLARWVRNQALLVRPAAKAGSNLVAEKVERFDRSPTETVRAAGFTPLVRSAATLNYLLRCPAARVTAFHIVDRGSLRGYFLLSEVGAETRIADLVVNSQNDGDWSSAYALATRVASRRRDTAIVTTAAMMPLAAAGAELAGFRAVRAQAVITNQAGVLLNSLPPLHLAMVDNDAAFL